MFSHKKSKKLIITGTIITNIHLIMDMGFENPGKGLRVMMERARK
jgi:hypothetical protein